MAEGLHRWYTEQCSRKHQFHLGVSNPLPDWHRIEQEASPVLAESTDVRRPGGIEYHVDLPAPSLTTMYGCRALHCCSQHTALLLSAHSTAILVLHSAQVQITSS